MNNLTKFGFTFLFAFLILAQGAFADTITYNIDPAHSQVLFKVKHFTISTVTGRFDSFEGTYTFNDKNIVNSTVNTKIAASSINTNNEKRDNDLKSPEFLDTEKYSDITFKSTEIKKGSADGKFVIIGDLTIHGVTKTVELFSELGGVVEKDPWGNKRSAFTAAGKINRKDFGIQYNKLMEAGGLVVGDEVNIILEVEGIKVS
ncbi:MAG: YceI family protein [Thermodesulfobacteriota bacterium]